MLLKNFFYILVICLQKIIPLKTSLPILLYHKTPDNFDEQLSYLKSQGYQSITIDEFNNFANHKIKLNNKKVLITFDDGYRDNFIKAYPILKKYGFSSVFFIITSLIGLGDKMTELELKELDQNNFIIANHFHSHKVLTELSEEELKNEYNISINVLENIFGLKETNKWFAYPKSKVNSQTLTYLTKLDINYGFIVKNNIANHFKLLEIPRIEVYMNDSLLKFKARLSPYYYFFIL